VVHRKAIPFMEGVEPLSKQVTFDGGSDGGGDGDDSDHSVFLIFISNHFLPL